MAFYRYFCHLYLLYIMFSRQSSLFLLVSFFTFKCIGQIPLKDSMPKKQILIFPVISRSVETDWSFGIASSATFHIAKNDTITRTSNAQGLILYSLKKQFVAALNGTEYFKKEHYILNEQLSYSNFPDNFWGIGKNTPDSVQEAYTFRQAYIYLHLMRHLGKRCYLGLLYEMQDLMEVKYEENGLFDKQKVAGRNPYLISGAGLSFTYDTRTEAFSPDAGTFAQVYFNHFGRITGSDYDYTNIVLDYRKFCRVYKKQVLALQGYFFGNVGSEVPIRSLASFGGNNSMRGFYDGRYRDKNQFVLQGEYRVPVYGKWGIVLFGSGGDVGSTFTDFSLNGLKYSYGGCIRFALSKSEKLNLRLDYGIGQGNNDGLYFQLGEAF